MTSPHTHPAQRETPAGEAMREAVAQWFVASLGKSIEQGRRAADDLLSAAGPIASELARLTERAEKAEAAVLAAFTASWPQDVIDLRAAEAALTTQRADHAAEVARLTEALRFYADEDAWSGQPWRLQFESPGRDGHGSDTALAALAHERQSLTPLLPHLPGGDQ